MKKIKYNNLDEFVYYKKLDNGFRIYLYPTTKTKNFYISISTKYGSNVTQYKKNNTKHNVIPGTAHFLEHRIMDFTKNKKAMGEINKYGSAPNAYTTYDGTNYNIFGSKDIKENIKMLLERVFYPKIIELDVKKEKGIINEEIDMTNDDPIYILTSKLNNNLYNSSYIRTPILGKKEDINKITAKYLNTIYKTFYTLDNMFMVITGDFNKDEILDFITEYISMIKTKSIKQISIIKDKEIDSVNLKYEEIIYPISENKIAYGIKNNTKIYPKMNLTKLKYYLLLICMSKFDSTSKFRNVLYEKGILKFGYYPSQVNNYLNLFIKVSTKDSNEFIKLLESELNNKYISEKVFERKRKALISSLIMSFEDILDVEDIITNKVLKTNKLLFDELKIIKSLNYSEIQKVLESFNFDNSSIVKMISK